MRHREAWAVDKTAPTEAAWAQAEKESKSPTSSPAAPRKRVSVDAPAPLSSGNDVPKDILVVVSKLKKYIKSRSGMNTSDNLMPVLSDRIRQLCDQAIRKAGEDGRRTVMDRDLDS